MNNNCPIHSNQSFGFGHDFRRQTQQNDFRQQRLHMMGLTRDSGTYRRNNCPIHSRCDCCNSAQVCSSNSMQCPSVRSAVQQFERHSQQKALPEAYNGDTIVTVKRRHKSASRPLSVSSRQNNMSSRNSQAPVSPSLTRRNTYRHSTILPSRSKENRPKDLALTRVKCFDDLAEATNEINSLKNTTAPNSVIIRTRSYSKNNRPLMMRNTNRETSFSPSKFVSDSDSSLGWGESAELTEDLNKIGKRKTKLRSYGNQPRTNADNIEYRQVKTERRTMRTRNLSGSDYGQCNGVTLMAQNNATACNCQPEKNCRACNLHRNCDCQSYHSMSNCTGGGSCTLKSTSFNNTCPTCSNIKHCNCN